MNELRKAICCDWESRQFAVTAVILDSQRASEFPRPLVGNAQIAIAGLMFDGERWLTLSGFTSNKKLIIAQSLIKRSNIEALKSANVYYRELEALMFNHKRIEETPALKKVEREAGKKGLKISWFTEREKGEETEPSLKTWSWNYPVDAWSQEGSGEVFLNMSNASDADESIEEMLSGLVREHGDTVTLMRDNGDNLVPASWSNLH